MPNAGLALARPCPGAECAAVEIYDMKGSSRFIMAFMAHYASFGIATSSINS
jgi:hypothetical protein